jgi:hypothetical protein
MTTVISNARNRRWLAEELACGAFHDAERYLSRCDYPELSEAERIKLRNAVADGAFDAALRAVEEIRRSQRGAA